ncbi:MAG: hypothetical protein ACT4P7_19715, partial [Gemmatimonadaceae bacterium]
MRSYFGVPILVVGLGSLAHAQTPATPPDSALQRLLAANRHELALRDGRLTGPGAEFLLRQGKSAQFFMVGEEHGVAELPQVITALLRELRPAGYTHFAVEVSPLQARRFNALRGRRDPLADLHGMFDSWLNAAPFYT